MRSRTAITLVTTGLFLATFGVAWREAWLLRAAQSSLEAEVRARDEIASRLQSRQEAAAAAALRRSGLAARLELLGGAAEHSPSYEGVLRVVAVAARPWRDIVVARNSKLQVLYLAAERAAIPTRYGPLIRALGLSAVQTDRFIAAEVAAAERTLDIRATAQAQGLDPADPAVATLQRQSAEQLGAAQADLLGADGYRQLQEYERTLPTRGFVDKLAGTLAFTDTPLSPEQAGQLVQLLAGASTGYQNGGVADPPRFEDYNGLMASRAAAQEAVDWQAVQQQARGMLTEAQFDLLNSAMQENRTTVQLFNMMRQGSGAPVIGFGYGRRAR